MTQDLQGELRTLVDDVVGTWAWTRTSKSRRLRTAASASTSGRGRRRTAAAPQGRRPRRAAAHREHRVPARPRSAAHRRRRPRLPADKDRRVGADGPLPDRARAGAPARRRNSGRSTLRAPVVHLEVASTPMRRPRARATAREARDLGSARQRTAARGRDPSPQPSPLCRGEGSGARFWERGQSGFSPHVFDRRHYRRDRHAARTRRARRDSRQRPRRAGSGRAAADSPRGAVRGYATLSHVRDLTVDPGDARAEIDQVVATCSRGRIPTRRRRRRDRSHGSPVLLERWSPPHCARARDWRRRASSRCARFLTDAWIWCRRKPSPI